MPIRVLCSCGHSFRVASEHAGKRIRCKGCKEPVRVATKRTPGGARQRESSTGTRRPAPTRDHPRKKVAKSANSKKRNGETWTSHPRAKNAILTGSALAIVGCAVGVGSDRVILGWPPVAYYCIAVVAGLGLGYCIGEEDGYRIPGLVAGPLMAIGVVVSLSFLDMTTEGRIPRGQTLLGLVLGGLPGYGVFWLGKKMQDLTKR